MNELARRPRTEENITALFRTCHDVAVRFGKGWISKWYDNSPLADELLSDLGGLVGYAFNDSLTRCAELIEFTRCFFRSIKDRIIAEKRSIAKHHRNRNRIEQMRQANVEIHENRPTQEELFGPTPNPNPFEELVQRELPSIVLSLMGELSGKKAKVYSMWFNYEMTTTEIAESLHIAEPTVRVHKHRACSEVHQLIKRKYGREFPLRR
jgi:DNA-directed RNA polymerase specialized sigma24 family protein